MQDEGQFYADMGNAAEAEAHYNMNAQAESEMQFVPKTPLSVLTLIDAATCEQFAHDMAALVQQGHVDPIQVRVLMSAWEKAFKSLKTAIEPEVEREAAKHGKAFDFMGAKCEWVPTYTTYDYLSTGDHEWAEANRAEEVAAGERKDRERFLRTLTKPIDIVSRETGEIITINPPVKRQTEGLKISIK